MLKSKRLIAVLLLLMVFFTLTLPAAAIYTRIDKIDNFNVNSVKGAVFNKSENKPIYNEAQLNTSLANFVFKQGIDKNSYEVSFIYKGEQVTAYGYLIPAAFNNNNHTDLLFAPIDFKSSNFNFTNILIQLNPKEYDLYPVNSDLVGKPIINIAITDKNTGDLVAWQFPLTGYSKNLTYDNFNISERTEPLVLAANEFYYIKDNMFTLTLTEEEIEQSSTSDVTPKIDVTPLSANNPYYSNWGMVII